MSRKNFAIWNSSEKKKEMDKENTGRFLMEEKGKRPDCPKCKTTNPVSNGMAWWCKSCGKQWVKKPISINKKVLGFSSIYLSSICKSNNKEVFE